LNKKQAESITKHQQIYIEAIRHAQQAGTFSFFSWFNKDSSKDIQQIITSGYWDLTLHILTPKVCEYIDHPEQKTALEIGYGGGRLINAACNYFHEVIGVDIHDEQDTVDQFLKSQGKTNFKLIKTCGQTLAMTNESIDFIYSFIVLQHLPSFDVFVNYMKEMHRCLRRGGVAQLYFGKYTRLHPIYQIRYFLQGYREVTNKPANHITLTIRISRVKTLCNSIGLHVVQTGTSYFSVPDGYPGTSGGQSYVTLVKI